MLDATLAPLLATPADLHILDPACGDGAFLRALAQLPAGRRLHLGGVDRDTAALAQAAEGVEASALASLTLLSGHALLDLGAVPGIAGIDWAQAFPAAMARGGFDAVVGNPPFLNLKRGWLSPAERDWLEQHYRSAVGQYDAFALFVERALSLLRPGGRLGLVLPKPVLASECYEPVRRYLYEHRIELVAEAGCAFARTAVEAVVVVAAKAPSAAHAVRFERVGADGVGRPLRAASQRRLAALPGGNLSYRADDAALVVVAAMDAVGRPLGEVVGRLTRGIEAGRRGHGIVPVGTTGSRPLLGGREVSRYHVAPPSLGYRPTADNQRQWKDAALYEQPAKILLRRVANRLEAALDTSGCWVLNTLYLVEPSPAMPAEALLACLNSRLLSWYLRTVYLTDDRVFPYLRLSQLRRLPVPPVSPADAGRLGELVRRRLAGETGVEEAIETLVAALYGVSGREYNSRIDERRDEDLHDDG